MNIADKIINSEKKFFSFEFFPPADKSQWPDFFSTAKELASFNPLFVSVTYGAGGAMQHNTLAITKELAKMGLTTMAHLTCVGAKPENLQNFLSELKAGGVNNVLALRGDPPANKEYDWSASSFKYASDLVKFIKNSYPEFSIGVAAYPFPHPESLTFEQDRSNTALKLSSGASFAITQLFFDVREYIDLVRNLRLRNIDVPIIPGIMPIQSMESLKRVLGLCGVHIPAKLYLDLEAANQTGGAEAVRKAGLVFAADQINKLLQAGAPGIHLYTLNKSSLCKSILEKTGLL